MAKIKKGKFSFPRSQLADVPPEDIGQPQFSVASEGVSTSDILIRWPSDDLAVSYAYTYGTGEGGEIDSGSVNEPEVTLVGLDHGLNFYFCVHGVNPAGVSPNYDPPESSGSCNGFTVPSPDLTATKLVMVTSPGGAIDGEPFTTQPSVRLQDADSVNVAESGVSVTVSKGSGTGTIGGTLTAVTNANGVATFTNVEFVGTGAHTCAFAASGLTGVTSASFDVAATSSSNDLIEDKPAAFSKLLEYGFPVVFPTVPTDNYHEGWGWNGADSRFYRVESDGPDSPPYAAEWKYNNGGLSGMGVGKMYHYLGTPGASNTRRIYVAGNVWHDADFEFNPVANKFLQLYPSSGPPLYLETRMNAWWQVFDSQRDILIGGTSTPIVKNVWQRWQWLVDPDTGEMKFWLNGTLIWSVNNFVWNGGFDYLQIDSTWGGTSSPRTRDSYKRMDHIYIATAPNL